MNEPRLSAFLSGRGGGGRRTRGVRILAGGGLNVVASQGVGELGRELNQCVASPGEGLPAGLVVSRCPAQRSAGRCCCPVRTGSATSRGVRFTAASLGFQSRGLGDEPRMCCSAALAGIIASATGVAVTPEWVNCACSPLS